MDRIFKRPFYELGHIVGPGELSIAFPLDEKRDVVPGGSGGERSGDARNLFYLATRSNSERAAPSACVGRRLSAPQIVWNRSTRRAGSAAERGLAGPDG